MTQDFPHAVLLHEVVEEFQEDRLPVQELCFRDADEEDDLHAMRAPSAASSASMLRMSVRTVRDDTARSFASSVPVSAPCSFCSASMMRRCRALSICASPPSSFLRFGPIV